MRVMAGAIGIAGHTLPAVALIKELRERGHEVRFHGFERWRDTVEGLGIAFEGGEDQIISGAAPGRQPSLAETARALATSIDEFRADIVVSDALTLSPLLAAEVAAVPRVKLLPEVYPVAPAGAPAFSLGLIAPRTSVGAAGWRLLAPLVQARLPSTGWLRGSHTALNEQRRQLGLPAQEQINQALPGELTLVATLPALEYPRTWPAGVHVTGPLFFDLPSPAVDLPSSATPLVFVAPSTVKDRAGKLISVTLEALAGEPVRVIVTTGGSTAGLPDPLPANAVVADWVDYSEVMREAALVICHGNHGTVVQALSSGVPLAICPAMPDDAEHGARVAWAGAGLMVPKRLLSARALRAVVGRLLHEGRFSDCAREIAGQARDHDAAGHAADLIEAHAEAT